MRRAVGNDALAAIVSAPPDVIWLNDFESRDRAARDLPQPAGPALE
jgi:hypothetical protein